MLYHKLVYCVEVFTVVFIVGVAVSCNTPLPRQDIKPTVSVATPLGIAFSTPASPIVRGELSVQTPRTIYEVGEPIPITLTWQITNGWVLAISTDHFDDFKIYLVDRSKSRVPYTELAQILCEQTYAPCDTDAIVYGGGSRTSYQLDPAKGTFSWGFDITKWYRVSMPGIYTLTVSTRNILDSSAMQASLESQTRFVSQPITFTVVTP